jgi:hypothetical protein
VRTAEARFGRDYKSYAANEFCSWQHLESFLRNVVNPRQKTQAILTKTQAGGKNRRLDAEQEKV